MTAPDPERVEAVARAAYESHAREPAWDDLDDSWRKAFLYGALEHIAMADADRAWLASQEEEGR